MWVIVFKRVLFVFKVEEYYDYECHGPTFLESQCVTMSTYDVKGVVEGFMLLSRSFENGAHNTLCESKVGSFELMNLLNEGMCNEPFCQLIRIGIDGVIKSFKGFSNFEIFYHTSTVLSTSAFSFLKKYQA